MDSCTPCTPGKTVEAGKGTCEGDCQWSPCNPAFYLDQMKGCTPCPVASWSQGGLVESCTPCPAGKTVEAGKGTIENDCKWRKYILIFSPGILSVFIIVN